eukprot:c25169_g2_i1 orf=764-2305(-)
MQDTGKIYEDSLPQPNPNAILDKWLDAASTVNENGNSHMVNIKAALISASQGGHQVAFSKRRLLKSLIEAAMEDASYEGSNTECCSLLINLIEFPDPDMQILGCLLLAKRANSLPEQTLKEAIPTLMQLLNFDCSSRGVSFKEVSVLAVKRLAKRGPHLRMDLGRAGAISGLLNLASQHNERLQILALQALKELVLSININQELFTQAGGLQVVLDLVSSCCMKIKCLTAEILGVLARLRDVRREIASCSGVSYIIEAVKVGSMGSRARAAHVLGLLAFTKRLRRSIVDAGGLPVLIDLLRDGDEAAKLVAGNSLGIVSACVDHLGEVAQAGAIPLFISLLEEGNPHGKDIAEDAFCILAVSEQNALVIIEHLVRILCYGSVEAKAAAADIIWDLSSYRHSVSIVIAAGAIPVLVGLLKAENEELRENVSGAISQLTYNDDDRQALAETGAIPILVELLQDSSTDVRGNAAEALNNFAEDPIYRSEILNACAVPGLVAIQGMARGMIEDADDF